MYHLGRALSVLTLLSERSTGSRCQVTGHWNLQHNRTLQCLHNNNRTCAYTNTHRTIGHVLTQTLTGQQDMCIHTHTGQQDMCIHKHRTTGHVLTQTYTGQHIQMTFKDFNGSLKVHQTKQKSFFGAMHLKEIIKTN